MADIICRWRNGTPQTVVELVNSLPHKTMPNDEFRLFMNNSIWGADFFRTPYQLACQLGLYYESDDGYYHPRFDHDIDVQEAQKYLEFWIPRYYVPNPYVGRNGFNSIECPTYMLRELYNYTKNNPNCTYVDAYRSVFHEEANNNNDIVRNYINNFSKVLRFEKNGVLTITDINPNTVFDFMDRNDKKAFFENFSESNNEDDKISKNLIFYGAPGTGKSFKVKKQTGEWISENEERDLPNVFRTTFHPDTDYASFVGCYKPTMKPTSKEEKTLTGKDEEIVYEFVPQTFTDAYIYAYTHSTAQTYLVIEEINRGNCAQIFGDLFQLLDRKGGVSEYKIKADKDLANYLIEILGEDSKGIKEGKLCLPANLNILATMNTSDQSLFPMDSAFKRRWEWEYVPINYKEPKSSTFDISIGKEKDKDKKTYSWITFIEKVNEKIFDLTQSEDKQLGNFFIKHSVDEKEFKSKVMFYLWYEVLRDETENNKYFFYKKTTVDDKEESSKFIFKDLYEDDATQTLQQFMDYLGVSSK